MEEPQSRLIINRIVLDNFKSYYGHLEIGPFHNQFTSIVGPNGSGKSNLIESLLFVFGKKASWMRLQKIHQLIHNSALHKDVKKASVEVQFLELLDQAPIPGSEIRVKRTVHHTGQSNYDINGRHATLEEVTTLLKSKNIDLTNNRFLILQGEVEQISLMKPKSGDVDKPGLLEYLEDIVGSIQFQEQIDQLAEQFMQLDVQRREKGEMMRIVEEDLEKLEPGKDRAVELVRREMRHLQLQNVQQQIVNHKAQSQLTKLRDNQKVLDDKLKLAHKESNEKVRENQEVIKGFKQAREELNVTKEQIVKYKGQMEEIQQKDDKLRSENNALSEQEVRMKKKVAEINQERSKCIDDTTDANKELPAKKKELDKLKVVKEELEESVESMNNEHRQKIKKLLDDKNQLQTKIHAPMLERQKLIKDIETLKNKLNLIKPNETQDPKSLNKSLTDCTTCIGELQKLQTTLQDAIREIASRSDNALKRDAEAGSRLKSVSEQLQDIQQGIDGISIAQNQQQEQNVTLKAIMSAAQQGKLKGVIGRVGDLASIDAQYDVAVSTASYGGLNAILVENQDAAQQCINFLKQNRIGRHTFMQLDLLTKLMGNEMEKPFRAPAQTQRLFDLIKVKKQEYLPVLYKVMQNTLVCSNIETANDLRFNKKLIFRFVTLDGKLVESNGLMSGGGQSKRGAMSTNSSKVESNDVPMMHQKLKELQVERQAIEQERMKLEHEILTLKKDSVLLHEQMMQHKIKLQDQTELKGDLEQKILKQKENEEQRKNVEQQRKQVEQQIRDNEAGVTKIDGEIAGDRKLIEGLEAKIKESESNQFAKKKEQLQQITTQFEKLDGETTKLQHQLIAMEKKIKKLDSDEVQVRQDLEKIQKKQEGFKIKFNEQEDEMLVILGKLEATMEEQKIVEQNYHNLQQQNQQITQMIQELKDNTAKIKAEIEDQQQQIKKYHEEFNHGKGKLEQIRLNYKEMQNEYAFLDELDEIASWKVQDPQQNNVSMMNISFIEGDESFDDGRKRGATLTIELNAILDIGVADDLTEEQLNQYCPIEKELGRVHAHLQAQIRDSTKDANINDIQEYKVKYMEYKGRKGEFDEVKQLLQQNKLKIDVLKKERYDMFMHGFNVISSRLREVYQLLTNGGDAELELVDTMDPFSEGISFSVRPKNKSWKQMSKLSGGEKTLSSLSLIFALHYFKPTPFYFFDEVDAALDYKNVSIVANFLKERTKNAQFIVISLRNNMFDLADKLVGIYKTYDMTKTISIQPELVQMKINQQESQHNNGNNENINKN